MMLIYVMLVKRMTWSDGGDGDDLSMLLCFAVGPTAFCAISTGTTTARTLLVTVA